MNKEWKLRKGDESYEIYYNNRFYGDFFPWTSCARDEETIQFPIKGGDIELQAVWFPRHVIEDLFGKGSGLESFEEYLEDKTRVIREWKAMEEAHRAEIGLSVRSDGHKEYKAYITFRPKSPIMNEEQLKDAVFSILQRLSDICEQLKKNAERYRITEHEVDVDIEVLRKELKCKWSLEEADIGCFVIKDGEFKIGEFDAHPARYELRRRTRSHRRGRIGVICCRPAPAPSSRCREQEAGPGAY